MSSISSIPASPPVKASDAGELKARDAKPEVAADAAQPIVLAPLPPGQGMRIDQLV